MYYNKQHVTIQVHYIIIQSKLPKLPPLLSSHLLYAYDDDDVPLAVQQLSRERFGCEFLELLKMDANIEQLTIKKRTLTSQL